jgi:hypothetical protein
LRQENPAVGLVWPAPSNQARPPGAAAINNSPSGIPSRPQNAAAWTWPTPANPMRPANTIELTRVAASGQRLRLDFLYSIAPDCSSAGTTDVRIREAPRAGTVTIENGQGFTNFPSDSPAFACNSRMSDGTLVFYQTTSHLGGGDSITLDITDPQGIVSTRHYAIVVVP